MNPTPDHTPCRCHDRKSDSNEGDGRCPGCEGGSLEGIKARISEVIDDPLNFSPEVLRGILLDCRHILTRLEKGQFITAAGARALMKSSSPQFLHICRAEVEAAARIRASSVWVSLEVDCPKEEISAAVEQLRQDGFSVQQLVGSDVDIEWSEESEAGTAGDGGGQG